MGFEKDMKNLKVFVLRFDKGIDVFLHAQNNLQFPAIQRLQWTQKEQNSVLYTNL